MGGLPNRFAVERELGRGGMGTVLLARDQALSRLVAIKVLTPEISQAIGPDRFAREIRLTAQLVHPNIVPLFDSGESDGLLYYVMPFIDGSTLRARVRPDAPMPVDEVVRIVADAAEALAYAHGLRVVHRDVKPENIFWYEGRALLADFGIARVNGAAPSDQSLTATGTIVGTVAYMSPEQATGMEDLDGRADLYSLGCVTFELLTGLPPYSGPTAVATIAAHLTDAIPSMRERRPDVDPGLAALVERLMAKDPADRPPTAAAVLDALRPLLNTSAPGRLVHATATRPRPVDVATPEVQDLIAKARNLFIIGIQGGAGSRHKVEMGKVYAEKAVALAPQDARALAILADLVALLGVRGYGPLEEALTSARALRLQALAIDDSLGELHTSLGADFLYWEDDFDMAGTELARGLELAPELAEGHRHYGSWLKMAGRPAEALEHMRAAVKLAPSAPFMYVGLADVLMALGRYDEAIQPLREALRLLPRYDAALERLEMSCHRAGRHDEAADAHRMLLGVRGAVERAKELEADIASAGWLAARERDLRRDLADLLARAGQEDPFVERGTTRQLSDRIIILLAELGDWNQAMDWVERAYHRRPGRLRRVLSDLPYDRHGLARDPRYTRLLRTAGLEHLV